MFSRFIVSIRSFLRNTIGRFRRLTQIQKITVVCILAAMLLVGTTMLLRRDTSISEVAARPRQVDVRSVSELASSSAPLVLIGKVSSVSEVTILSESSGRLRVYKRLGDFVSAGDVIAEFENSNERAAVLSAEGAYQAAQIARDIAGISRNSTDNAYAEAKISALNTLQAVYTTLDDAIRQKTDVLWSNPRERNPQFIPTISDSRLLNDLERERVTLETILLAREQANAHLTSADDLAAELTASESEAREAATYLDNLSLALSRAIPDQRIPTTQIDGWKTVVGAARQSVNGTLTAITGVRNALQVAAAQRAIAEKNAGTNPDLTAADAQVKSALGALRGAQARLEKTIVRSTISGTINTLYVETGDFVSPFSPIAIVSNNRALEIIAYVTEEDAQSLTLGERVAIEGNATGVLTRIAPAVDPRTKKIEIRIGILSGAGLVNGQSVTLTISRGIPATAQNSRISLPLSAIKFTPQGAFVFTVTASSTLNAEPVELGPILGDRVVITRGVTSNMRIVSDARGLKNGATVEIKP